jgi:hypothetical protein
MDSRAYLFIFPVNTAGEIPDDFRASLEGRPFEQGIFLPQADTDWFTRSPEYPARLLLLEGSCLYIIPHPASSRDIVELNLADLVQLETGSSLLSGWIQLSTRASTCRLLYNTRASDKLDQFVADMRRRWLGAPAARRPTEVERFGPEPDIKFRNLLDGALGHAESVLSQCFTAPLEYQNGCLLFRRNNWRPGHLVALTSANRLLWLKDEYRGHWERYAGITVSAPVSFFRCCKVETTADHDTLVIDFMTGNSWRIAIHRADSGCAGFSKNLNGILAPAASQDRWKLSLPKRGMGR